MQLIKKDSLIKDLEVCSNRLKEITEYIDTEGNIAKNRTYYNKLIAEVSQTLCFLGRKLIV